MKVWHLCAIMVGLFGVWLALPASRTVYEGDWSCTDERTYRFAPIPSLTMTQCRQWTRRDGR